MPTPPGPPGEREQPGDASFADWLASVSGRAPAWAAQQVARLVDAVLSPIAGGELTSTVPHVCTIQVIEKAGREARNPQTGELVQVSPRRMARATVVEEMVSRWNANPK